MGLYLAYMVLYFTNSQFTVRKIFVSGLSLIYSEKSYKGNCWYKIIFARSGEIKTTKGERHYIPVGCIQ